jgi:L-alanine-DL-glutamate epimerase-like enolase superfamily enzyme
MLNELIEKEVGVRDGMIAIPDRPGLGLTMREDVVRQFAVEGA